MLLYIAGHETTVNLIGNGTLALLRNRDQLELLRDDPSVDATFVDELLRYDSPGADVAPHHARRLRDRRQDDRAGLDPDDVPRFGEPRPREVGPDRRPARPAARRRARPHVVRRRLPLVPRRAPRPARRPGRDHARSCAASRTSSSRPTRSSGTAASCSAASTVSPSPLLTARASTCVSAQRAAVKVRPRWQRAQRSIVQRDGDVQRGAPPDRLGLERERAEHDAADDRGERLGHRLAVVEHVVRQRHREDRGPPEPRREPVQQEAAEEELQRDELQPVQRPPRRTCTARASGRRPDGRTDTSPGTTP